MVFKRHHPDSPSAIPAGQTYPKLRFLGGQQTLKAVWARRLKPEPARFLLHELGHF
jgi:hypothetical protein